MSIELHDAWSSNQTFLDVMHAAASAPEYAARIHDHHRLMPTVTHSLVTLFEKMSAMVSLLKNDITFATHHPYLTSRWSSLLETFDAYATAATQLQNLVRLICQ